MLKFSKKLGTLLVFLISTLQLEVISAQILEKDKLVYAEVIPNEPEVPKESAKKEGGEEAKDAAKDEAEAKEAEKKAEETKKA